MPETPEDRTLSPLRALERVREVEGRIIASRSAAADEAQRILATARENAERIKVGKKEEADRESEDLRARLGEQARARADETISQAQAEAERMRSLSEEELDALVHRALDFVLGEDQPQP